MTAVNLLNVDAVVAHLVQDNVALLARHAGTTTTNRRARLRAEKFMALQQGLKDAFAIPLMPESSRKRPRVSLDEPYQGVFANLLQNERVDFARSQGDAQLCIAASNSSDKTFGNLLCKLSEAA